MALENVFRVFVSEPQVDGVDSESRVAELVIHDGDNILNLNWDDLEVYKKGPSDSGTPISAKPHQDKNDSGYDLNVLRCVYPNPFN
jgi:hypothetical protein